MSEKRQLYAVYAVAVFLVVVTLTFLYSFTLNNDHVIRISESLDVVAHSVYFDMRIVANRPDLVGTLTIFTPLSRVPPDCTNCPDKLLIWIDSTSYAS